MLHELKRLVGSPVMASDGKIGRIHTFLLDDRSWMVRYIVVEVSHWVQRDVVLAVATSGCSAISAYDQPDWATCTFHVHMTRRQVNESPDIETKKPVSLQQRLALEEQFGLFATWIDQDLLMTSRPTGVERPVHGNEDPHLRSTQDMHGYVVGGADGTMGSLQGFVLDESSWHIGFLNVKSGGWLRQRSLLIPSRQVQQVSWAWRRIHVYPNCEVLQESEVRYKHTSSRPAEGQLAIPVPEC